MKTILFKSLCLVLFTFSSCIGQEQAIRKSLRKCIDENVKEKRSNLIEDKFDFFPFVKELERLLVEEKIISSDSKKAYVEFLENKKTIIENKKIRKFLEDNYFVIGEYVDRIILLCPYKTMLEEKVKYGSNFHKHVDNNIRFLGESGFSSLEIVIEFVKRIKDDDFSKIEYRYPVILLAAWEMDIVRK